MTRPVPTLEPTAEPTIEQLARRVDDAVRATAGLDGPARAVAEELKSALEEVHRAGLVTMVRRMRTDEAARELLFELVDDPVVRLLFSLHGIIRLDPPPVADTRADTVANTGANTAANQAPPDGPSPVLIPVQSLWVRPGSVADDAWVEAAPLEAITVDAISPLCLTTGSGRAVDVIVVNLGHRLTAYQNACAHEGMPLDNALLDFDNDTLTCPWHGFCYDAMSGECLSAPGAQLEQLPLRIESGQVWIRVGT